MSLGKKKILSQGASGGGGATDYFIPKLYSGGASGQVISQVGFQPDLIIGKRRDSAEHWWINDVARPGKSMFLNLPDAEISFQYTTPNSDGFVVNGSGGVHNTGNLVAYCFKGGGSTSSNTTGSITSQVSANVNSGFSVIKFDGAGLSGSASTVGHGLNSAPEFFLIKTYEPGLSVSAWFAYAAGAGNTKEGYIQASQFFTDANRWNSTSPTTSVITLGSSFSAHLTHYGGDTIIYAFHSVAGKQKVGTYTATGSAGSPTISTGFQPRFVMVKNIAKNQEWIVVDSARNNGANSLRPESNAAENTAGDNAITLSPTSFTIAVSGSGVNYQSGDTFIYLAIA